MTMENENRPENHLEGIGQIALTVGDLARARDFYRDKLGLPFLFDAGPMVFFQCGGIRLMLGTSPQSAPGTGTILYFKVRDIRETYRVFQERGVVFTEPPHCVAKMPTHDLWLALFRDPDDHPLSLMCELPSAAA